MLTLAKYSVNKFLTQVINLKLNFTITEKHISIDLKCK